MWVYESEFLYVKVIPRTLLGVASTILRELKMKQEALGKDDHEVFFKHFIVFYVIK